MANAADGARKIKMYLKAIARNSMRAEKSYKEKVVARAIGEVADNADLLRRHITDLQRKYSADNSDLEDVFSQMASILTAVMGGADLIEDEVTGMERDHPGVIEIEEEGFVFITSFALLPLSLTKSKKEKI